MKKKGKLIISIAAFIFITFIGIFLTTSVDMFLSKRADSVKLYPLKYCIASLVENKLQKLMLFVFDGVLLCAFLALYIDSFGNFKAEQYEVTSNIKIPKFCGQGQHGTEWWMSDNKFKSIYSANKINPNIKVFRDLINSGYDDLPPELHPRDYPARAYLNNMRDGKELFNHSETQTKEIKFRIGFFYQHSP